MTSLIGSTVPMLIPTLAINPYLQGLFIVLFLCVSLLLVLVVLIQRPQGGGLSGAFGSSSGSGQTAFGTKTGDALTIATIILFTVFVLGAIVLNFTTRPPTLQATTEATSTETPAAPLDTVVTPNVQPAATPPPEVVPAQVIAPPPLEGGAPVTNPATTTPNPAPPITAPPTPAPEPKPEAAPSNPK